MQWIQLFDKDTQPTPEQISEFIHNLLWEDISSYLFDSYQTQPKYSYSSCSGQPGWNVKYQKSGRSLCTLYPMDGFFIALVVIGSKEEAEAELMKPTLSSHVQELYSKTESSSMGRWLMISVTDARILEDVKQLISLRRKAKTK